MAEANTPPSDDDDDGDTPDSLGVLLLGRTGLGNSTTGNKLLKAAGESVLCEDQIEQFAVGDEEVSCTHEVRSLFRRGTEVAKAVDVVDTPGFADSNTVERLGVYKANLAVFRDLIREQINEKLRIHRVLYFLPHRGPLERADAVLQEEIEVMHHFFGNAIFERMVLVATLHKRKQRYGFDDADREDTIKVFQKALTLASIVGDRPKCPPIICIRLEEPAINILSKVESAEVVCNEGLILDKFVQGTCSKCAAKYLCHKGDPSDPDSQIAVEISFRNRKKDDNKAFFPYDSSMCHPLFIPKYRYWVRAAGGAGHIATLGIPALIQKLRKRGLPWPTFTSNDEMCVNCKQSPGSDGCMNVRSKYRDTIVDHTNLLKNEYEKYLDVSCN